MARRSKIPDYGTVTIGNREYYRYRMKDADGKPLTLYGKTRTELYDKVHDAENSLEEITYRRNCPTVKEYSEKWLMMHSAHIRATTLIDYTSKVKNYIIKPLGNMYLIDVKPDGIKLALITASKMSVSIYRGVNMLVKAIFKSAEESGYISKNPAKSISARGGIPQKERSPLTDEQVKKLLDAVRGLPPYVFIMIGLYAGLRREEILALKWDCVFLDCEAPYISVRKAWHTENNRPVILDELKTNAARRDIPIPECLQACLREAKAVSSSEFVVANNDGGPLSYTQFKRLWAYVTTRSTKERSYYRYINGTRIRHTVRPTLGKKASHNGRVVYSLDFQVTPHQLRHTYITNLIHASVDPKTVQYLAGHENSKITMDIYAKAKYNRPCELAGKVNDAFRSMAAV